MAEEQQDVETLKRRGRRRLVGAVALVLLAVIVLPMVFDPEPKSTLAPLEVRIPGENETTFAPKPPPKPTAKAEPAPVAPSAGSEYVIQVGAFSRPDSVIAKLASAKLPYYTEPLQGNLTRVRAGPFGSREAADQALAKLKELGLKPGAVNTK
ncbi:MAG TPA: SPOR domain-containing protein [Burkholderiales bacterium]|nr:SPOR domain-containing protein [Burkholderiales bacterium]